MYVDNMLYTLDTWVTFCTYQIDSMKMNAVRSLSFSTYLPLSRSFAIFFFYVWINSTRWDKGTPNGTFVGMHLSLLFGKSSVCVHLFI